MVSAYRFLPYKRADLDENSNMERTAKSSKTDLFQSDKNTDSPHLTKNHWDFIRTAIF